MEQQFQTQEPRPRGWVTKLLHHEFLAAGSRGISPADMHRRLRAKGASTSYKTTRILFYCLRELGLIQFVSESAPTMAQSWDKLLYRITPGKQDDPRWKTYPLHNLYPATRLGGGRYEPGMSAGRAKEYA
ncbi:hypothetical protein M1O20_03860 [Dehalococcoidia bacterium]|nr:hypothetical protein [Dehalococcoidia bacterium]MCL0059608.1 hypothetical protein [Dehalococcoidia bacterium]